MAEAWELRDRIEARTCGPSHIRAALKGDRIELSPVGLRGLSHGDQRRWGVAGSCSARVAAM